MKDSLDIKLLDSGRVTLSEEEMSCYDSTELFQITLFGKSKELHALHNDIYHACDCTFNRAKVYPDIGGKPQSMIIYSLLEEKDTVYNHLRYSGVLNLHLWRL